MPPAGANGGPNRPRRAKSMASIRYSQSDSANRETIDQDALTAAALAFERANGRTMAPRTGSRTDVTGTPSPLKPQLARKQSVRFVGPKAMPTRQRSITRREAPGHKSETVQSPKGTFEEEYFDNEVASMPSSHKRIRKIKSMYSPRKTPSFQLTYGTPRTKSHARSHSEQSTESVIHLSQLPKPHLRRSFSFVRGKPDHLSSNARQNASSDVAVQMARDQYLQHLEQQRLKTQPSVLMIGKRPKSQKAFRRTVRSGSTNSYGNAIASTLSNTTEPNVARGMGDRARSISYSLKNKLKRVFHRSSDTQEVMPVQQLDASRLHFGDYMATSSGLEQRYEGIPSPDSETLLRVSSRESPLRNSPVYCDRGSPAGSIRSARSDDSMSNGKSRVSSWTNSTAANTLSSRQKRERKRLSVIQENGSPHQPSSSIRSDDEFNYAYNAFRKPMRNNSIAGRTRGLVDSKRIYSALQRRLGEKGRHAVDKQDHNQEDTSDQARFHLSDLTPRRSSLNSLRETPGSLRAKSAKHSLHSSRGMKVPESVVLMPSPTGGADDVFSPVQALSPPKTLDTHKGLTPQEVAQHNDADSPIPKRPLREVKSGFFPPNLRFERSKTSPFRRAMHVRSETEINNEGDLQAPEQPFTNLTHQPRLNTYGFSNGSFTRSESVYSRTPSGNTPKPTDSSLSLAKSESSGEAGTAFILASESRKYEESRTPFAKQTPSSTKSSGDWQKWMASEVATLESRSTANTKIYDVDCRKRIGHKRENAKLDDEDVVLGELPRPNNEPKQPLAVVHGNVVARPVLEHKTSYSMIDRFPLLDIAPTSNVSTPKHDKPFPNDPCTGQIRSSLQMENERYSSSATMPHTSSGASDIRNKVSSASLRSQANGSFGRRLHTKGITTDSPGSQGTLTPPSIQAKLQVKTKLKIPNRHSPERLARLRRMRSSAYLELSSAGEFRSSPAQSQHQGKDPDVRGPLLTDSPEARISKGDVPGFATNIAPIAGSQDMVDLFLNDRRRNMTGSDDSGQAPAFL